MRDLAAGVLVAVALVGSVSPVAAQDDPADLLGRRIVSVRVDVDGRPMRDAGVEDVIRTVEGDVLDMPRVRETIEHLVGLERFADVRVYAEAARDGVALRWALTPVVLVTRVSFTGDVVLDARALRSLVAERLGTRLTASRVDEIVELLRIRYRARGYPEAVVEAATQPKGEGLAEVVVRVTAGPRAVIRSARVTGRSPAGAGDVLAALDVAPGRPYDRVAIDGRLATYEEGLRALGYYEAAADFSADEAPAGRDVDVVVDVRAGPRVEVVFAGDALDQRLRDDLVPVRRERSVDRDLLEDGSRSIERHLRAQGYRAASAPYDAITRGGEMTITFTVSRGPLHRLNRVTLDGVSAALAADVEPLVRIEPGEPFVDARVAAVVSAVAELYRVQGYPQVEVTPEIQILPAEVAGSESYRPVDVRVMVSEGVRTLVGDLAIDGASAVSVDRVRETLRLLPGRPFYRPQMLVDRDAIERLYRDEGFPRARVDAVPAFSRNRTRVDIAWTIQEGPRSYVDHVLVTGNVKTSVALIRREIVLRPGEPLGERAVVESQQRLSALGLFRRVRITELRHGASPDRDIVVEVEEAPATTVAYGGGLEIGRRLRRSDAGGTAEERIEIAPRAFFEVGRRNLWGKNRSVNAFTRVSLRPRDPAVDNTDSTDTGGYGFNEYRVVGLFREPRAFGTPGDVQVTAFIEQAIRASFNFKRLGAQAEYARRTGSALTLSARYALNQTRLFDEQIASGDQLLIDRLFPRVRLSTITGSVLRDSRDDVLDPTRGTVVGIDGSLAARRLGSEVGFTRTFLQSAAYRRLPGHGFVLAASARVGFARGFERQVVREDGSGAPVTGPDGQPVIDTVEDVPASERFYAGGDTTVRGFALDRLGTEQTLNEDGFPTGGNGLVVLNLEMRAPYWKGIGAVGFIDYGNVFKRAGDMRLADLRGAAGFGVRYRSPIGPIRVDLGFKLDRLSLRDGSRERAYVLHISLGQAF